MHIIDEILQGPHFREQPPVLIDIGASGEINRKWKRIARYSICIAFDADDREFHVTEQSNSTFRKLFTFNRIVTDTPSQAADFFLTKSPFCSSHLAPDNGALQPWLFSSLFEVERKITLPSITVAQALSQIKIENVDWFKTDTQGTDLRLFKSLPAPVANGVLATEFEPGIIDAYSGEDKLHMVMEYMHSAGFWLSSMQVKGIQRINDGSIAAIGNGAIKRILRNSPCWAEVTYLRKPGMKNARQLLLLYIFAVLEKQYGFAIEVADYAAQHFSDPLFARCKRAALKKMRAKKWQIPIVIGKRQFNKFFSFVDD